VGKELAIEVLAKYLEDAVSGAKGSAVSVSVRQVSQWYERRTYGGDLPRSAKYYIGRILKALHGHGYLEEVEKKFVLHRGSELWKWAASGRARDYLTEFLRLLSLELQTCKCAKSAVRRSDGYLRAEDF